jgi:uncharacterized protein YigE (DUF2233 family)
VDAQIVTTSTRAMRHETIRTMGYFDRLCRLAPLFALACFDPRDAAALESRVAHVGESDYRIVTLDLSHDALDLCWLDAGGLPYGSIDALRRKGEAENRTLLFATNAGIYDREYKPLGLTIADSKTLRPLNTARGGSGNFGIQPNGVFYVDRQGHAGVVATAAWRDRGIDARIATQSGPMLVVDGAINPNFVEDSDSRKWRSGVCARTPDEVVFAVSEVPVTFHAFARVFRDEIGCGNALYLDGTLSQIYTATGGYTGAPAVALKPYAGMLAVFANMPASP